MKLKFNVSQSNKNIIFKQYIYAYWERWLKTYTGLYRTDHCFLLPFTLFFKLINPFITISHCQNFSCFLAKKIGKWWKICNLKYILLHKSYNSIIFKHKILLKDDRKLITDNIIFFIKLITDSISFVYCFCTVSMLLKFLILIFYENCIARI